MKPTKCPATEKKIRREKKKKWGGEKWKEKEVGRREVKKKSQELSVMPKLHINEYFASGSGGRKVYDLWTDLW